MHFKRMQSYNSKKAIKLPEPVPVKQHWNSENF